MSINVSLLVNITNPCLFVLTYKEFNPAILLLPLKYLIFLKRTILIIKINVFIVIIFSRMLTKRAQGRKKFGRKNFKQRYFKLTTRDLSYAKQKGKYYYVKYKNIFESLYNNNYLILS